jgi:hypothetical protein
MLYNLYPTNEWELSLLLLPDTSDAYDEWKAAGTIPGQRIELGVFFDSLGNLKQVIPDCSFVFHESKLVVVKVCFCFLADFCV